MKFKKIASVLASAGLIGSTIGLGLAANFPAPFVANGAADVAVVYGANSAATDLVAVTDITSSLSGTLASQTATGGTSTSDSSGDDFVRLDKSSDKLNLGDAISDPFGTSVDDEDMSVLLADGVYTADDSDDFDYEQKIKLGSTTLTHFRDSDYETLLGLDERTPVLGFKVASGQFVAEYTLDFLDDAESDLVSGDLDDIEGSDIPLMGNTYYVSDAKDDGDNIVNFGKFTLLDSATQVLLDEGETMTLDVAGTAYDVSAQIFSGTEVVFTVNGATTNTLNEGETQKLSDGSYIAARDILYVSKDTGISSVDLSIGKGKLELTHGADIKLNEDSVAGVKAYMFKGTNSSSTSQKIDKIVINWTTDDEEFITAGSDLVMPGFGSLEFSMNDFVRPTEDKITIEADGDTSIEMDIPIKDGNADINLVYTNATGEIVGIGKAADERLATSANGTLTFYEKRAGSDYHTAFVVSYASSDDSQSYLLDLNIEEDTANNRNETTIKNIVTGDTWDERTVGDQFDLGDVSFTITTLWKNATDEYAILTAGSNVNFSTVYTTGGLKVQLPYYTPVNGTNGLENVPSVSGLNIEYGANVSSNGAINITATSADSYQTTAVAGHGEDSFYVFFDGEDKEDTLGAGVEFNVTINENSDNELQVSQVNNGGTGGPTGLEVGDSSKIYEMYIVDAVAPRALHYTDPNQDWAEIFYPQGDSESYAEVFLGAVDSAAGSGGGTSVLGSVSVTDAETSSVAGKNWVVVGGSCINGAAADLLGGALCGDDFEEATGVGAGSFLIETFARSGGKVATVAAGYNAGDTTNAATYLTTQTVDTSAGMKYVGTSATSATLATA